MYKNFCTYEQAVLLKELGFKGKFLRQANSKGVTIWRCINSEKSEDLLDVMDEPLSEDCIGIPLKCDVLRWFRDIHDQFSQIGRKPDSKTYFFTINGQLGKIDPYIFETDNYDFAEQMCISENINILKNKIK